MRLPLSISRLLPHACLLCGSATDATLCPGCTTDLPRLDRPACPVCAQPLAHAAPCCADCLKHPPTFAATFAALRYGYPIDRLMQRLKFGGGPVSQRLAGVDFFARLMLAAVPTEGDLLLPVPLANARLRERGFNQALELARPLARAVDLPLDSGTLVRERDAVPQSRLPWHLRRRNVRHTFACRRDLSGLVIVVVDDVMTSGATLNAVAEVLRAQGAVRVINWVAARAAKQEHPL